jgi:hypothetical protein
LGKNNKGENKVKKLRLLALLSTLLTACDESSEGAAGTSGLEESLCHTVLKSEVRISLTDAIDVKNKGEGSGDACRVSIKLNDIYHLIGLDLRAVGTANELKTVGIMEMSQFDILKKMALFYKNQEELTAVGDYALYYTKAGVDELLARSGDNAIQLWVFNEGDKGYDKALAIQLGRAVLTELPK